MEKKHQLNIIFAILAVIAVLVFQSFWTTSQTYQQVSYSEFLNFLENGQVSAVIVQRDRFQAELKEPQNGTLYIITNRVEPSVAEKLARYGVEIRGTPDSTGSSNILS